MVVMVSELEEEGPRVVHVSCFWGAKSSGVAGIEGVVGKLLVVGVLFALAPLE